MTAKQHIDELGLHLEWQSENSHSPPKLNEQEIHLWCINLNLDDSETNTALSLLNDIQRDKYHRRANPQLKAAYLAGRFHLLNLLAAYSGITPEEVLLSYSRFNKPYLNPNPNDIEFNFTDTLVADESVGLFAFTRSVAVGVDIEALTRKCNAAAIVAKRFSRTETDFVKDDKGVINLQRVLSIWTRKEAFGKATGKGINFKMSEVDLASPGKFSLEFISNESPSVAYRLQQIQIEQKAIAAIVHEGHHPLTIQAFKLENHMP